MIALKTGYVFAFGALIAIWGYFYGRLAYLNGDAERLTLGEYAPVAAIALVILIIIAAIYNYIKEYKLHE